MWQSSVIPSVTSTIVDNASVHNRGRAKNSSIADTQCMTNEWKWRQRLENEIEKSGRSLREISLSAGFSAGYLHSILTEGKDPSISRLMAICSALDLSTAYILHGINLSSADETLLEDINSNPDALGAVRAVLTAVKGKEKP